MSQTSYVDVEPDVALCVERWPADQPGAPVALALHGFSGCRLHFSNLAEALDGKVELLALDCRGRGRSSHPDDPARFGMRRHAEDAAAVLRALDLSDVVVVGTSMGAWIAMQLAAHHPDLVRSLVLVDGGHMELLPAGTDPVEFINWVLLGGLDRMDLTIASTDIMLAAMSGAPGLKELWDPALEAATLDSLESTTDGVRARLRRYAAVADAASYNDPIEAPYLRADLPLVLGPVHLITAPQGLPVDGERCSDPVMPESTIRELGQALPQMTQEQVDGTNHLSVCLGRPSMSRVATAVRGAFS